MDNKRTYHYGFTIIELLIATTVFSVILMSATAALIQLGRMYYKGVITSKTQGVARTVMDDVSRTIQFSSGNIIEIVETTPSPTSVPINVRCVGTTRYTYVLGTQVNNTLSDGTYIASPSRQILHALWQDKVGAEGCNANIPDLTRVNPYSATSVSNKKGRELLENNMRLQEFNVVAQDASADSFSVSVKVIYGDDDLLDNVAEQTACKGSVVGGQWCAISELSSVVYSRAK